MGSVYAFVCPSMQGIVKIGATRCEVAEVLKEANRASGRDNWRPPHPYVAACVAEVEDPFAAQSAIYTLLATRRVDPNSEFFEITPKEAHLLLSLLAPPVVMQTSPSAITFEMAANRTERLRAKLDGAYSEFRDAQDALDAAIVFEDALIGLDPDEAGTLYE